MKLFCWIGIHKWRYIYLSKDEGKKYNHAQSAVYYMRRCDRCDKEEIFFGGAFGDNSWHGMRFLEKNLSLAEDFKAIHDCKTIYETYDPWDIISEEAVHKYFLNKTAKK